MTANRDSAHNVISPKTSVNNFKTNKQKFLLHF